MFFSSSSVFSFGRVVFRVPDDNGHRPPSVGHRPPAYDAPRRPTTHAICIFPLLIGSFTSMRLIAHSPGGFERKNRRLGARNCPRPPETPVRPPRCRDRDHGPLPIVPTPYRVITQVMNYSMSLGQRHSPPPSSVPLARPWKTAGLAKN